MLDEGIEPPLGPPQAERTPNYRYGCIWDLLKIIHIALSPCTYIIVF